MRPIIFLTETTVSTEIVQCKWLISFSRSQSMKWGNSESHGKTKGWWPPPTVSCPLKPGSSPPELAGDHTTDPGLWSGWLIDCGICGWKKIVIKTTSILDWMEPFTLIIPFWTFSFIPSSHKGLLGISSVPRDTQWTRQQKVSGSTGVFLKFGASVLEGSCKQDPYPKALQEPGVCCFFAPSIPCPSVYLPSSSHHFPHLPFASLFVLPHWRGF